MITNKTKKHLQLITAAALILSVTLTGKAFADENADTQAAVQVNKMNQVLISWNDKIQTTLSSKMENRLELEMQAFANTQSEQSLLASHQVDNIERDLVLISTDENGAGITAQSTTPVVIIIDQKELCLLKL